MKVDPRLRNYLYRVYFTIACALCFVTCTGSWFKIIFIQPSLIADTQNIWRDQESKNDFRNERLKKMLTFIQTNCAEKITLELLEKRFFLSRFTISRKLKAYTGMSLPQYVNTIRLIHAKKMLRQGLGVTDTALACGFGSVSDFDRIFCAETQMTPSQYRKQ